VHRAWKDKITKEVRAIRQLLQRRSEEKVAVSLPKGHRLFGQPERGEKVIRPLCAKGRSTIVYLRHLFLRLMEV